jgi:serine phosphatase RsbU (regulator of sigma subunit)
LPELIIRLPDGRFSRHVLTGAPQVLGRDATCDIPVDDPSTSRRHARIYRSERGFVVEDLGSKNGTLVNDLPCTGHILTEGDRILMGSVVATFSESGGLTVPPPVVVADDAGTGTGTRYATRSARLALSQRRLEMIYELSGRLTMLQSQEKLLESALDICFETLNFERGAVGVRRQGQRTVDWPIVRNLRGAEGELKISRTLFNRALEHGERAIFTEGDMARSDPTVSIVQHGIRSAMCVPLMHRGEILGVLYGDRVSTATAYSQEDVDFLAGIGTQISIGLINARLLEEQRQMARLNYDLDLARRIQTGLFPKSLPDHEGLRIAALNEPGQRISGDYYDVIERPDGRVWCIIADVTGEGASAALLMANLQAAVRLTIDEEVEDPAPLLARWNRLICANTEPSKFITCLCALIDPAPGVIRLASAGHYPPLLLRTSGGPPEELGETETSFPLGVSADAEYQEVRVGIDERPFALFCYTDGVVEAINEQGQMFGHARLLDALAEERNLNPAAHIKLVRKSLTAFVGAAPQSDDITMLAARVG